MTRYRTRPDSTVGAVKYAPERIAELLDLCGEYGVYSPPADDGGGLVDDQSASAFIVTVAGVMEVRPGDWVVRGPSGELMSVTAVEFALRYEAV